MCPLKSGNGALLLDYAGGRLESHSAAMIDDHVRSCSACSEFLLGHAAVVEALDIWQAPPVAADFNRRLWVRIDAGQAAPWYTEISDFLSFGFLKRVFPVAAAALVIAAGFLFDHPAGTFAPRPARVSATEADQAERTLDDIQLLRQFDAAVAISASPKSM